MVQVRFSSQTCERQYANEILDASALLLLAETQIWKEQVCNEKFGMVKNLKTFVCVVTCDIFEKSREIILDYFPQ